MSAIIERSNIINKDNKSIEKQHKRKVKLAAYILIFLYVFFEIIFELCMCFCSKYDFIKFLEQLPQKQQYEMARNRFSETGVSYLFPGIEKQVQNGSEETGRRTVVKGFLTPSEKQLETVTKKQVEKQVEKQLQSSVPQHFTKETVETKKQVETGQETVTKKQIETPVSRSQETGQETGVSGLKKQLETVTKKQVEKQVKETVIFG